MKTLNLFPDSNITQINGDKGRLYQTLTGARYPSVTTVVGILNAEGIAKWRAAVGEAKANAISSAASTNGTAWHNLCESYLKNERQAIPTTDKFQFASAIWLNEIYPKIDNIRGVEYCTYSDKLKCAGTIDLVADWEGELSIIDWKTTRHLKNEYQVVSYWCQLACYAYMIQERFGLTPKQLVLVFNQSNQEIYYYKQPVRKWLEKFIEVRKQYKNQFHC